MVDRHLLAIVGITGIMSTALVSLLFHERIDAPIQVLREDWNLPREAEHLLIPSQEGRYAYTLAIVARREIVELALSFAILENKTLPANLSLLNATLGYASSAGRELSEYISTLANYSGVTDFQLAQHRIPEGDRQFHFLDLTEAFLTDASEADIRDLTAVHAFMVDGENRVLQHFRGTPDFFVARDSALVDLTVQLNDNVTKYSQRPSEATGTVALNEAPPYGSITFRDLKKDDRISIAIAFNPARVPGREALMQFVRLRVDGEEHASFLHILRRAGR